MKEQEVSALENFCNQIQTKQNMCLIVYAREETFFVEKVAMLPVRDYGLNLGDAALDWLSDQGWNPATLRLESRINGDMSFSLMSSLNII